MPEFTKNAVCPVCGDEDTMSIIQIAEKETGVIWCSHGHLFIILDKDMEAKITVA